MLKVTYDFYIKDFFGNKIPGKSFPRFEFKARTSLDGYTFRRLRNAQMTDDIGFCICEMAEYLYDEDNKIKGNGISSESTDGHSVTYQNEKETSEVDKDLYKIACKYLGDTPLMYRGV